MSLSATLEKSNLWSLMMSEDGNGATKNELNLNDNLAVTMPVKCWISTLYALERLSESVPEDLQKLREDGVLYRSLDPVTANGLVAPVIAKGLLGEILHSENIITDEAYENIRASMAEVLAEVKRQMAEG